MKRFISLFLLIAAATLCNGQQAKKAIVVGNAPDSIKNTVVEPFWKLQSSYFRNNEVPSFIFVTPTGKFSLGIGGYANLTTNLDFNGISNSPYFETYQIPVPKSSMQTEQFQMYANTSLLYLKAIQKTTHGDIVGYFSTSFVGPNNTLAIWQIYLKFRGWEFGQDWSSFVDINAWPTTVNFAGFNAMSEMLNLLIRYQASWGSGWSAGISLEQPNFNPNYPHVSPLKQRIPDIPAYIQYRFKGGHVRLAGVYRNLYYNNTLSDKYQTMAGFGGNLTGNFSLSSKFQLFLGGIYGKGLGSYIQDLSIAGLGGVPGSSTTGELNPLKAFAAYGALQYNFTPNLFATAGYGHVSVSPGDYSGGSFFKQSDQLTANLMWTFVPSAQMGVEYCWGKRVNQSDGSGTANRMALMMQYNF